MTLTDTLQPVLEKTFPAALVAASLLLATPALAAPPAPQGWYDGIVAHVLGEAFKPDILVSMLYRPAMQSEYAIALRGGPGSYRLVGLMPQTFIWVYANEHPMADTLRLPVARCEFPVSDAVARDVLASWRIVLQTMPAQLPDNPYSDVGTYRFALHDGHRSVVRETYDYAVTGKAERLVVMADLLRLACRTRTSAHLSAIPALADAIAANQK